MAEREIAPLDRRLDRELSRAPSRITSATISKERRRAVW